MSNRTTQSLLLAAGLVALLWACGPKGAQLFDQDVDLSNAPVAPGVDREPLGGHLASACEDRRRGELKGAKAHFIAHLRANPRSATAHYELGLLHMEAKRWDRARWRFERAFELDSNLFGALSNLGVIGLQTREQIAAVKALEKAIALVPADPRVLNNLANAWLRRGRINDAIESYARARKTTPDHATMLYNEALAHLEMNDGERAVELLKLALAVRPGFALGRALRVAALHQTGRLKLATQAAQQDLELITPGPDNHLVLGRVLIAQGKVKEGMEALQRAVSLGPKHGPAVFALAEAQDARRQLSQAVALYKAYLKLPTRRFEESRQARRRLRILRQATKGEGA